MKRKLLCAFALLFIFFPLLADEVYYYGNGSSSAHYYGTTATVSAYDLCMKNMKSVEKYSLYPVMVEKLSKEEENFLWGALNTYDYKPGEVYSICIKPLGWRFDLRIWLFVEIQKNGSIIFYGYRY